MIRICKHYIPWNLAFLVITESLKFLDPFILDLNNSYTGK